MGLIEEIGVYLDSASTRFSLGVNTTLNFMVDEPHTATSIIEYSGGAPEFVFAGDLPTFENARVALTFRSTSSTKARANAHAAWVAVGSIANESLSGKSWLRATPLQSPFFLRRDEQGRSVFQFSAACVRRTTST